MVVLGVGGGASADGGGSTKGCSRTTGSSKEWATSQISTRPSPPTRANWVEARGDQQTSLTTSFRGDDPSLRNEADGFWEACVHNLTVQSALQLKNTLGS